MISFSHDSHLCIYANIYLNNIEFLFILTIICCFLLRKDVLLTMMTTALLINPSDNVAVLFHEVKKGEFVFVQNKQITSKTDIPAGHKICIKPIHKGERIIKYGLPIGLAIEDITIGEWVHSHNVSDITEELCNEYASEYFDKALKE